MEIQILKSLIFYAFSGAIVLFALLSVFSMRILYALISAVCVFFATAGIFFLLGADYNAVVQIAIYGIAIPIVFIFAIMFTADKLDKKVYLTLQPRAFFAFFSLGILFLSLIYLILTSLSLKTHESWVIQKQMVEVNKYQMFHAISNGLFSNYVVGFELLSILLLVVVVGISTFNLLKEKTDE